MRKITNITIITLVVLFAIFALNAFALIDMKKEFAKIQGQLAHMDEEVDAAASGVERLLLRKSTSLVLKENGSLVLPRIQFNAVGYDFGQISKRNGVVKTDFLLTNSGRGELVIGEITTSCGCTSVIIDNNRIMPSKEAVITVSFDPNFHEEPQGRFSRSIFVPTNDPDSEEVELKIFVEIKD